MLSRGSFKIIAEVIAGVLVWLIPKLLVVVNALGYSC
jgi:hypothetical protein